jgi:hypothetical protein
MVRRPKFYLGLDLGQAADYTALGVLERLPGAGGAPAHYQCRALERFDLGTPYPQIVEALKTRLALPALRGHTALVVDATGVGRAVVDMLDDAGLAPVRVTITGGNSVNHEGTYWNVPKRDLVSTMQVLFQTERLKFAGSMPMVPVLIQELLAFQVKITAAANDTYGAWREGSHDDLVLALAVAAWYAENQPRRIPTGLLQSSARGWNPQPPPVRRKRRH